MLLKVKCNLAPPPQINSITQLYLLFFFSVAPKIWAALHIAETYMEQTEKFSGKVSMEALTRRCNVCSMICMSVVLLFKGLHHSKE